MDVLGWLHHVADWASPIAQILAIPTAIVTFIVSVRRVRRWLDAILGASTEAARESREARTTVLALIGDDGKLVTALPESDDQVEYLRDLNNRLVAQLVIQASKHPEDFDSPTAPRPTHPNALIIPADAGSDDDPATTSGRHRLHRADLQGAQP